MSKDEDVLKLQESILEHAENVYKAGYNDAIEAAEELAKTSKGYPTTVSLEIRKLKKP